MRSYRELSGRYLKQQRKRSVLTVIGIILSVALIFAIGTMAQNLKDNMYKQEVYDSGSFHFAYPEGSGKLFGELKNNVLVGQIGVLKDGPETKLGDFKVNLKEGNADLFRLAPLHLKSGAWPSGPNEIVVEEWMLSYLPGANPTLQLGDSTQLDGPDGAKTTYRIAGVLNNTRRGQENAESTAYTLLGEPNPADPKLMLYVKLKPGVDISDHLPQFAKLSGDTPFSPNDRVLAYMGESSDNGLNRNLFVIFGTLIGLVVLSTAAVIYNIFHVSVLERIRQFGLLRTLGATPSQIRGLVFREATTLAAIGIPLGLVIGWSILWLVIRLMLAAGFSVLQMDHFELVWHTWILVGSVVVGLIAVYLASWLPARKAASVSPIEAVKGAGGIARESIRRGLIPSPLQTLGVSGKMASKNIRRNRSKFRITTFSIVVSVMLFIVFHYFTQEALRMSLPSNEEAKVAFSIYQNHSLDYEDTTSGDTAGDSGSPRKAFLSQEQLDRIAAIPGVLGAYGIYSAYGSVAWVPEDRFNQGYSDYSQQQPATATQDGQSYRTINTQVRLYDAARLKEAAAYLVGGTADPEKLAAQNAVLIVQAVKPLNPDTRKREVMNLSNYRVGDKLLIDMSSASLGEGESAKPEALREVTVGGILSQAPFGAIYQEGSLLVAAPPQVFDKLAEAAAIAFGEKYTGVTIYGVDVAVKDDADNKSVRQGLKAIVGSMPNARLVDVAEEQKQQRQFNLQMQIFIYGFLLVIGLIGSLNIINTVQTNLLLRRREFGLLQAVGMTVGQLRRMASLEGIWFGVLGGFWGLVLGSGVSYLLYLQLNNLEGLPFRFPVGGAIIACGCALAVGLLSVQGPMRRLRKMNLIDSLREEA